MAKYKEPKDFMLARRAYEAWFDEQPQIWFEDLGHPLQVRWTKVARAVMEEIARIRAPSKAPSKVLSSGRHVPTEVLEEELRKTLADLPVRGPSGRIDWSVVPRDVKVKATRLRMRIKKRRQSV